ncbi:unnamed protein product, partial [Mesorhabditis spiculigera]
MPLRSQRASDSWPSNPWPPRAKPGPPSYYTLPENFHIPDYRQKGGVELNRPYPEQPQPPRGLFPGQISDFNAPYPPALRFQNGPIPPPPRGQFNRQPIVPGARPVAIYFPDAADHTTFETTTPATNYNPGPQATKGYEAPTPGGYESNNNPTTTEPRPPSAVPEAGNVYEAPAETTTIPPHTIATPGPPAASPYDYSTPVPPQYSEQPTVATPAPRLDYGQDTVAPYAPQTPGKQQWPTLATPTTSGKYQPKPEQPEAPSSPDYPGPEPYLEPREEVSLYNPKSPGNRHPTLVISKVAREESTTFRRPASQLPRTNFQPPPSAITLPTGAPTRFTIPTRDYAVTPGYPSVGDEFPRNEQDRHEDLIPPPNQGFSESPAPPTTPQSTERPYQTTPQPFQARQAKVMCVPEGVQFSIQTVFPFHGQIFATNRETNPKCLHTFEGDREASVFLPYQECGVRNENDNPLDAQYHLQIAVMFNQQNGSTDIQSFMAQCEQQRVFYNKQKLPKRIEEALEELHLVPSRIEQKAPVPDVEMRILIDNHHDLGDEVSTAELGTHLAIEWRLVPESDAYGFHVRKCVVRDSIDGREVEVVDAKGCSSDLLVLHHPHYDTYHDVATAKLWAFKIPDHSSLTMRCDILICSNVPISGTNVSSCANVPTPPFCPDLITSAPNSISFDQGHSFRKRHLEQDETDIITGSRTISVRSAYCIGEGCAGTPKERYPFCLDPWWAAISTGFTFSAFAISLTANTAVRWIN